jgi:two-component system sensor histidine kinase BarA
MMDGSQVLRELRASPGPNRYAPVIAITAYCANEQREAILQEGFAACLIKPILQEELTELVNSWLDTQNKQGALETSHRAEDYASAILRKTNGNRELAGIITHKLSAELPETLRQVEIATAKRERENARRIVHSLNGAAGFAGLESLRQAAAHLETALGQGKDWEALEESCQGLGREIAHFLSLETAILDSIAQISNEAGNL